MLRALPPPCHFPPTHQANLCDRTFGLCRTVASQDLLITAVEGFSPSADPFYDASSNPAAAIFSSTGTGNDDPLRGGGGGGGGGGRGLRDESEWSWGWRLTRGAPDRELLRRMSEGSPDDLTEHASSPSLLGSPPPLGPGSGTGGSGTGGLSGMPLLVSTAPPVGVAPVRGGTRLYALPRNERAMPYDDAALVCR